MTALCTVFVVTAVILFVLRRLVRGLANRVARWVEPQYRGRERGGDDNDAIKSNGLHRGSGWRGLEVCRVCKQARRIRP